MSDSDWFSFTGDDGEPVLVVREGDALIFKQKTPTADTGVAP